MDPLPSPCENAIHSTHTYLAHFRYPLPLVYELCKGSKFPYPRNPAIRIDNDNPAVVYFFTHALTTNRRLDDMYSATFKRKPGEGVGHDLTNRTSL